MVQSYSWEETMSNVHFSGADTMECNNLGCWLQGCCMDSQGCHDNDYNLGVFGQHAFIVSLLWSFEV